MGGQGWLGHLSKLQEKYEMELGITPQSPESQQSACPTRLSCPSPCRSTVYAPRCTSSFPATPKGSRKHFPRRNKKQAGWALFQPTSSWAVPHLRMTRRWALRHPRGFFSVRVHWQQSVVREIWPSVQPNCSFQIRKLVSYQWYISCLVEDDSLSQVIVCVHGVSLQFQLALPPVHSSVIAYLYHWRHETSPIMILIIVAISFSLNGPTIISWFRINGNLKVYTY